MDDSIRMHEDEADHAPVPSTTTDLATTLEALAREINEEHDLGQRSAGEALEHYIRVGELLLQAKGQNPRQYQSWVAEHCRFSYRSAAVYVEFFRERDQVRRQIDGAKVQPAAPLTQKSVLKSLAKPKFPSGPKTRGSSSDPGPEGDMTSHDLTASTGARRSALSGREDGRSGAEACQPTAPAPVKDFVRLSLGDLGRDLRTNLEACPIRSLLADPSIFDREASCWFLEEALLASTGSYSRDDRQLHRVHYSGVVSNVDDWRSQEHPKDWPLCSSCEGGKFKTKSNSCHRCNNKGFVIKRIMPAEYGPCEVHMKRPRRAHPPRALGGQPPTDDLTQLEAREDRSRILIDRSDGSRRAIDSIPEVDRDDP